MKKNLLLSLGAVAAVIALIFLLPIVLYAVAHQGTDDAKIDADVVTVTSKISERVARILVDTNQPVRKGQILMLLDDRDEHTHYDQALAAYHAAQAQADAAGENVAFTRDQQNAQNQQNEGSISQAQSGIVGASAQTAAQEEQVDAARAAVQAAQAQLKAAEYAVPAALENLRKAQADFARNASLVKSGDVAQAQLDAARATYASAQASYQQTLANVNAVRAQALQEMQKLDAQRAEANNTIAQIGAQRGQLEIARGKFAESDAPSRLAAQQAQALAVRAQAASATAQVKDAADQLSYTKIVSSIDGYVGEKNVEAGQMVSPGLSLLTLIPSKGVYVTAKYKETQIGKMRVGAPVDISVDAYPGVKFHGRVATLSPASDNTFSLIPAQNATANFVKVTQRVPVRISFENPDPAYALRPGMSVEANVDIRP